MLIVEKNLLYVHGARLSGSFTELLDPGYCLVASVCVTPRRHFVILPVQMRFR